MKKRVFIRFMSSLLSAGMIANLSTGYECLKSNASEVYRNNKISPDVLEMMESANEEIPVVIWSYPVQNSDIEELVIDKIGFSLADLEEEYVAPSKELIDELKKASAESTGKYFETLMKDHMKLTAGSREIEQKQTDLYLKTKREIVSDIYTRRAEELLEKSQVDSESVWFKSKYTPMLICSVTPDKINEISEMDNVEEIVLYEKPDIVECSFPTTDMKDVMKVNNIYNILGLTGTGVKIGIYDAGTVESQYNNYDLNMSKVTVLGSHYYDGDHSAWCASVAAGNYGVAPDAEIVSVSNYYDWLNFSNSGELPAIEDLISYGVKLINVSWGVVNTTTCYNNWSKYFDQLITTDNVTVVCATGNDSDLPVLSPSSAYNCIAVNAFSRDNNVDILRDYSYQNGYSCLKPDVIADTFSNGANGGWGTSTAAPVISGMIALLMQYKPSLAAHPELTKAILMASCHKNATKKYNSNGTISNLNESLSDGLSDYQGAGIPDMYTMISIASQHSYGSGILNSSEISIPITQGKYGASNMNITMAYLQTGLSVIQGNPSGYADYDIELSSGNTTRTSSEANSSTEMIYTDLFSLNDNYTFKIEKYGSNTASDTYGYAWSTDQAKFRPTPEEEGIYYFRNKSTNNYMTKNSTYSYCEQGSYAGNNDQRWILKYMGNNQYILQSGSGNAYGMKAGSSISGNHKHVTEGNSSDSALITVTYNEDGSYTFTQTISGTTYALGLYNNYVSWSPYNVNYSSQKWYIESLQWRRGDVNMDGIINSTDASIVQQHINYTNPITVNINKFLADADLNHVIDVSDVTAININAC